MNCEFSHAIDQIQIPREKSPHCPDASLCDGSGSQINYRKSNVKKSLDVKAHRILAD